ncbi:LamG domain-containing protein [Myxococcota bacterium]|nr:LamG domain-containing protein [Myxococcota bacterium]
MLLRLRRLVRATSLWVVVVGLLVFTSSGVASATPAHNSNTLGLVGAWEFTGDANDVSGNGNDGVVHGATLTTDRFGNPNSAYSFDGNDDYIRVGSQFAGQSEYTQAAWVSLGELDGQDPVHIILNTPSGAIKYQHADRTLRITPTEDRQGGITSNPHTDFPHLYDLDIADGTWFHVAVAVFSDNTANLFVDGYQVNWDSQGVDGGGTGDYPVTVIGAGERSNYAPYIVGDFSGEIDDLYIYDRALSASEVLTLATVPEPNTALLLGVGLAGLAMRRRR